MPKLPNMNDKEEFAHSYLFTVRMWLEQLGKGSTEWRGKVQHVLSGQTRYFRDWQALITFIRDALPDPSNSIRE